MRLHVVALIGEELRKEELSGKLGFFLFLATVLRFLLFSLSIYRGSLRCLYGPFLALLR